MTDQAPPYQILTRTAFPGPGFPPGQRHTLAVTFRLPNDLQRHTVWIDQEIANDSVIDEAIRRWIQEHPSP